MGQTLTHGIYLPDEGERNCYSGLAANWQILDTSVGTIAEHTSALAGKAPLVHTHTKSDITDFPAYGTTAGTICEGNDSRLSDARTPVAHTHVTADVTDLLNTAHEWTKAQTYSDANAIIIKNNGVEIGNEPSAYNEQRFIFRDKNNQQIAAIKYQNQLSSNNFFNNSLEFSATDKFKDGVRDATGTAITTVLRIGLWNDGTKYIYNDARWRTNLLPFTNNATDLGSSSYQWNNLYAKNYYYNGTPWGLDKNNKWLTTNIFYGSVPIFLRGSNNDIYNVSPQSLVQSLISFVDKNNTTMSSITFQHRTEATETHRLCIRQQKVTSDGYYGVNLNNLGDFYPEQNNAINLGTSTNKWKTLNGINPGALSLPNSPGGTGTENVNYFDLSGNITVRDGSAANSFTALCDGWIAIGTFATWLQISNDTLMIATTANPGADGFAQAFLPVRKGNYIRVVVNQTNTQFQSFKLLPCEGNV